MGTTHASNAGAQASRVGGLLRSPAVAVGDKMPEGAALAATRDSRRGAVPLATAEP